MQAVPTCPLLDKELEADLTADIICYGIIFLFLIAKAKRDWGRYQRIKSLPEMNKEDRLLYILFGRDK